MDPSQIQWVDRRKWKEIKVILRAVLNIEDLLE